MILFIYVCYLEVLQAWRLYEGDTHLELVDGSLNPDEYETETMKKIIEIALMCTQSTASLRPAMSEVVVLLRYFHRI